MKKLLLFFIMLMIFSYLGCTPTSNTKTTNSATIAQQEPNHIQLATPASDIKQSQKTISKSRLQSSASLANSPGSMRSNQSLNNAPNNNLGKSTRSDAISASVSAWLAYTDAINGFGFNYPNTGTSLNVVPSESATISSNRIELPIYKTKTNLNSKYLQINVSDLVEGKCMNEFTSQYTPEDLNPTDITISGITWKKESQSDAGAGQIHVFTAYSTIRNGKCISLTFLLHSANRFNFEPPLEEYNLKDESEIFELIIKSFHWLD